MPVPRILDPNKFVLLGAVTDWLTTYRRHVERAPNPKDIARQRGLDNTRIVQLRWLIAPDLGYPTAPFRVWRRPAMPVQGEAAVAFTSINLFGLRILNFDRPRVFVRMAVQAPSGGSITAYSGAPYGSAVVAYRTLNSGFSSVSLSGPGIQCVVVTGAVTVQSITGLDSAALQDPSWQPVEIVGLPVDESWNGVLGLDAKQGLVASPGDPRDAALDRFRRGAPFYGWDENITPAIPAPPWVLADPKAMIKVMADSMLEPMRKMVITRPPKDHASYEVKHVLRAAGPITNDAMATFRPLQNLVFGAATDPLVSLISGFGTAFPDVDLPPVTFGDRQLFNDSTHSDWDFMVTALYGKGLDGQSDPVEYAAIVFAPGVGAPPPVPTNLAAASDGLRAPAATDADWFGVVRVSWDKVDDSLPFRVGSYAFARARQTPAGPVVALMDPRPHDKPALQPISATTSPEQESATGRLQALDERYALASAPNPNGLLYGLAHQDLFGLWSTWSNEPFAIGEPPVRDVSLISARLDVISSAAGNCPGTLTIQFAWDWATRSPKHIAFVGRLYGQTKLGEPPANLTVPAGLQTSLAGGAGFVLALDFNGAAAPAVSTGSATVVATVQYLSQDGKTIEANPVVVAGPRRYRLTVSGFALNFDTSARIGLALWARAIEFRAPQRGGNWSGQPLIASTADPRPPIVLIEHEDVLMASMADSAGLHHARLEWPAASGAHGYFVYTTTEEKLRADRGMASALRSQTLSQRLAALRDAFAAEPSRRSFTRLNAQPVPATSMQVTLPRGSKEIHLYVVLAVSAGQVESVWPQSGDPGLRKRPLAYAAPQVVVPSPPDLEVSRVLDNAAMPPAYRAQLRIRAKPGAQVTRIDLHRVRVPEAAVLLDTMGPPIARISGSTADYNVTPAVSAEPGQNQPLGVISGRDAVGGSWKRVFYRAVAWSGNDPVRGLYGSRSAPSALREVVVPPATPPDLSPLTWQWPGGPLPDAQIDATTLAPVDETPLGPHRLKVDVLAQHADGTITSLFSYPSTAGDADRLDRVATAPPVPGAHGVWQTAGGTPGQTALHVLVRRASTDDTLKVRFLMTDPLGRATEQLLDVPPGVPIVAPDILVPNVVKVPGKGFLLTFETSVPVPPTPIGPFVLGVRYTPKMVLPFPVPGEPRPIPLPISITRALHEVRIAVPGENVFADPDAIPLRRTPAPSQRTLIGAAFRGKLGGTVNVTLTSPDGRVATLKRVLS